MPFSPPDITGLQVWLKADAGLGGLSDGDPVSTWADQSGGGNDFTGSSTARPLYKTGIQNSLPGVLFDGSDDILQGGNLSSLFPSAATVFVVYNRDVASAGFNLLTTKSGDDSWWMYDDHTSYIGVFRSSRLSQLPRITVPPGGACHQVCIRSNATDWRLYNDGALCGTQTAAYDAGSVSNLGAYTTGSTQRNLKGYVHEVIMYDTALSDADRGDVEAYLAAKWDIDRSADPETPSSIAGLKLWLKADKITGLSDTDPVKYWPDASGLARDWTPRDTDSTRYPQYQTDILNGLPGVKFDGSNDILVAPGNPGEQDFPSAATVFVVATTNSNQYTILFNVNNTDTWRYTDNHGYLGYFRQSRITNYPDTLPSSGGFIFTLKSGASNYRAYLNGSAYTAQSGSYPSASQFVNVWTMGYDQVAFNGWVHEVLIFDTELGDTDRQTVEAYLLDKWFAFGQATETDTAGAITVAAPIVVAVAQATETDTAQPVAPNEAHPFAQAAETDTAQAVAALFTHAFAQAAEADTAAAFGSAKAKAFGAAAETDTAETVSPTELHPFAQAAETDTAAVIAALSENVAHQAAETDTAQVIQALVQPHGPGSGGSPGGVTDFWVVNTV